MNPLIRIATPEDLASIMILYAVLNPGDRPAPVERLASTLKEIVSSPYFEVVVAETGARVVGTCYLNIIPNLSRGAAPYAVIENVVVAGDVRRQGVGRAVLGFALDRAWARGCYKAMLQTGSKSDDTHQFYRSCGFSQTEKRAFVARPAGRLKEWIRQSPNDGADEKKGEAGSFGLR